MSTDRPWARVGPHSLNGRYLRQSWQPVYRSVDLAPGRAIPLTLMGERFALYRGESGAVHMVDGRCPHRHTLLGVGQVQGEGLRCMHHGWCWDRSGSVVDMPGETPDMRARHALNVFAVTERYGLIFAHIGTAPAPPMWDIPGLDAPGFLRVLPPEVWPCSYFARLENTVDLAHLPFAHHASGVGRGIPKPPQMTTATAPGVLSVSSTDLPIPPIRLWLPNLLQFSSPISEQVGWRDHFVWRVPMSDTHCVTFSVAHIPAGTPDADGLRTDSPKAAPLAPSPAAKLGARVLRGEVSLADLTGVDHLTEVEDYVALVGQGPLSAQPPDHLGAVDAPVAQLRRIWRAELANVSERKPTQGGSRRLSIVATADQSAIASDSVE